MYFVNYLNRRKTDPFFPLYEIIYAVELAFIASAVVAGPVVIILTFKATNLHRLASFIRGKNIRLRIIFTILIDVIFILSRVLVINHEYFGPAEYVETPSLFFGSLMKEIFLGYITALYESSKNSTLLFFLLQEAILISISCAIAFLLIYDHITSMHAIYAFAMLFVIGSILLVRVYRHNQLELRKLKQGAVIHRYSIRRTYQIRENVFLLSAYKKIARPLVFVCIPPFLFSPVYQAVPPNIGFDAIRYFCASMYNLWLSVASLVMIIRMPYFLPQLKLSGKIHKIHTPPIKQIAALETNILATGDTYFAMLSKDLGNGL